MNAVAPQKLLDDLLSGRSVYLHQYDVARDQLLLVRLDPDAQAAASFLDDRVLAPQTQGAWFTWDQIAAVAATLADRRPHYIFHMGHCGSTLISRLISAAAGAVAMREPLPLRALAFDAAEFDGALLSSEAFAERLSFFERCWARGPDPVTVKATSICTDLAVRTGRAPVLFLYQAPRTHLAAFLAGKNSLIDLRSFAQMRHRRLSRRFTAPSLSGCSVGELAAMAWLTEASAALAAHDQGRLEALNFENFLAAPELELKKACGVFDLHPGDDMISNALSGPIMKTYSKAPEHAYSPAIRAQIIADAAAAHGDEIRRGLALIDAAGKENNMMARTLDLFAR